MYLPRISGLHSSEKKSCNVVWINGSSNIYAFIFYFLCFVFNIPKYEKAYKVTMASYDVFWTDLYCQGESPTSICDGGMSFLLH